ncbi:hypothetical protein G6F57_018251 [Rhizopus arrhizus]|nr:hypothetical protein G6F57_018251 [Rhizopus arrhizus]
MRAIAPDAANPCTRRAGISDVLMVLRSFRSAPAQNAAPAAWISTTLTSACAASKPMACTNSAHINEFSAFRLSGRFSVTVATRFSGTISRRRVRASAAQMDRFIALGASPAASARLAPCQRPGYTLFSDTLRPGVSLQYQGTREEIRLHATASTPKF